MKGSLGCELKRLDVLKKTKTKTKSTTCQWHTSSSDPDWPSACWGSSWRNAVPSLCASQASHGQTSPCPGFSTSQTAPGKQCSAHTKQNKIKMGRWLSVVLDSEDGSRNPDAVLTKQCCVNNAGDLMTNKRLFYSVLCIWVLACFIVRILNRM